MSALEAQDAGTEAGINEVRLVGRVGSDPEERTLAGGETVWAFRVNVARESGGHDSLDCAVRAGRARRAVSTWATGDLVEVSGAIRKRFFRAGGATAARVEVEVARARVIRRAGSG